MERQVVAAAIVFQHGPMFIRCDAARLPKAGGGVLAEPVWYRHRCGLGGFTQGSAVAPDEIDIVIGDETIDLCEVFRVPEVVVV